MVSRRVHAGKMDSIRCGRLLWGSVYVLSASLE